MINILFLHPNFPAQFRHLAAALANDSQNKVVYGTTRQEGEIPGVRKIIYKPHREPRNETHHYLKNLESAVLHGQAIYKIADGLRQEGFIPDVVYGHSGWGPTMFIKDIYPHARFICYFEWFYRAEGSDVGFDPNIRVIRDTLPRVRMKNAAILTDLYSCDRGISPTLWQKQQFPGEFKNKIAVIHDGINTNYFSPNPSAELYLPSIDLDLRGMKEIVTYAARGMEPYRGFPQFMEALDILEKRRTNCHVVIVGEDKVFYSPKLPGEKTFKQFMLEKLSLDESRIYFTGHLSYPDYLKVLQASATHVYLTYPFVLSWSMLEAMSTECLVIASNTEPVTEIIQDGINGLLVDFFSPQQIADRIEEALGNPERMKAIRSRARKTILDNYDLAKLLSKQMQYILGR